MKRAVNKVRVKRLSPEKIAEQLKQQKQQQRNKLFEKRAKVVVGKYRPRKKDLGKLVMVGTGGQKDPQKKGRKGYLIYVTKTGKKRLIKDAKTGSIRPKKLTDFNVPFQKNLMKPVRAFYKQQAKLLQHKSAAVKGRGKIDVNNVWDFSDKIVKQIAASVGKTLRGQRGRRVFLITALVLVKLPNGQDKVYEVIVDIAKPDNISISQGGIDNFIRLKFYATMARQLAYDGYVTSGSANHVRSLKENKGKPKSKWTKGGEAWIGRHDTSVVKIQRIEWKIEQL